MNNIRMVLTQEVDVTTDQVRDALAAWAERDGIAAFPHQPGEFVRLTPDLAGALSVHAEAPAIVLGVATGCAIGIVGFVSQTGVITPMAVNPNQVRPAEDAPEADPEA